MPAHDGIIANPNCSTIIAIVPLWPIHKKNRIKRLIAATYQAASGAGAAAMEELRESTRAHLEDREYANTVLPHPYAFNLFSHNSKIDPATGYNEEETKMVQETKKIFGDAEIRISATCVRVPVLRAHSEALTIECERPITPAEVREILADAPGVKLIDDPVKNYFPMPKDASGSGRCSGGPHPPGHERSQRQIDCDVCGGRSIAEGRGAERGADRRGDGRKGAAASSRCEATLANDCDEIRRNFRRIGGGYRAYRGHRAGAHRAAAGRGGVGNGQDHQ